MSLIILVCLFITVFYPYNYFDSSNYQKLAHFLFIPSILLLLPLDVICRLTIKSNGIKIWIVESLIVLLLMIVFYLIIL